MTLSHTTALRIHGHGDPQALALETITLPPVGDHDALVEQHIIGVNYIDVQHRSGRYPIAEFPAILGVEAAGVVQAVGAQVQGLSVGDQVAYIHIPIGAYAHERVLPAERLIKVPTGFDLPLIGTTINRALTAQYLVKDSFVVRPGCTVLVHAAMGGVGQLLVQWARALGARVLGTVGSQDKVEPARALGCDAVVLSTEADMVAQVRALTQGEGVHAVYDGIGGPMFDQSLHCLRPCGTLVSFGTPAGPIPPLDVFRLNQMGSLYVTSPSIFTFIKTREALQRRSDEVFAALADGTLKVAPPTLYPFEQAAQAHIDLQARRTTGSLGLRVAR